MKKNSRLFAFLLALVMLFTVSGCRSSSGSPGGSGTTSTVSSHAQYDEQYISELIAKLEGAVSAATGNYDGSLAILTADFEAKSDEQSASQFAALEAGMQSVHENQLYTLSGMIDTLLDLSLDDEAAVSAKVAEAEAMLTACSHVYGEMIRHSRNPEGTACTDADHYQICTKCNDLKWSKGEHSWLYSRDMEGHQKCCLLCDATEDKAQHNTNDQGKCSECNYIINANILIIESIAGESEKLCTMIGSGHTVTVVDVKDSTKMPASIDALKVYDEVILVNIANRDMPEGFAQLLQTYVQELGGGLLTVGGNTADSTPDNWEANAYDREDLLGTVYQDMLPVEAIPPTPPIAVLIIIDHSGSMWDPNGATPYEKSKLYAAKQGAEACLDELAAWDYVGILPLSDQYYEIPELIPRTQRDKILKEIDSIEVAGGTIFGGALVTARRALLANTKVEKRHIIMVTDGEPGDASYEDYLSQARLNAEAGITMSVVGIGCGNHAKRQMIELVEAGGGTSKNFYDVTDVEDVPNRMREDLASPNIKDFSYEAFIPTITTMHQIVADISAEKMPMLDGCYNSMLKEGATEILGSPYGPLYAQWVYGKGIVSSFMCDLNGNWSADFIDSEEGAEIIRRVISLLANSSAK